MNKDFLLPEGEKGIAKIEYYTVSESQSLITAIRDEYVPPGTYVRLMINDNIMMSNTPTDKHSCMDVIRNATGKVLIGGLGIGLILNEILNKQDVTSVLVVEKYRDVIDLVLPSFYNSKLMIECADILNWKPLKGEKFDTIYFDIWPTICIDNLQEINRLHRRAAWWKNPGAWVSSWQVDELRYLRKRQSFGL